MNKTNMYLIVGLGNPGRKYQNTRHNIGFSALEPLYDFENDKKSKSLLAKIGQTALVCLPQTFMNNSGEAVLKIANYYKIKISDIWIIHDDIDLPLGTIRVNFDSSSAGHHGVDSIIGALGEKNFWRIRLGIGSPDQKSIPTESFVLMPFSNKEQALIDKIINKTREIINESLGQGLKETTYTVQ